MHIGLVSATYDAGVVNGVLRMIGLYQQHLEARGHQVTIFALGNERQADLETGIVRSPGLPLGNFGYYAGLGYTPEAQRLLATMDIVHCHHLFMSLEMAHRYAAAPIVYTNHTRYDLYAVTYTRLPQSAADAIMRYAWPHYTDLADHVIAPSAGMQQVMFEFNVRTPTSLIENGIELEPFLTPEAPLSKTDLGIPEGGILCIYCGRLSVEKAIEDLVHHFAVAAAQRDDLHLLLIGKGSQGGELQHIAAGLGLSNRIHLAGAVPFREVGNYLAAGDLFVTASTSEVHPLTVIEAMASGLPVVAIRSPGIDSTVISGETGLLVGPPGTEFSDALLILASDPALRQTMGAAARKASLFFDINHTVDRTLDLYAELLQRRPDLRRKDPHGRWRERTVAWEARLSELSHVLQLDQPREQEKPGS